MKQTHFSYWQQQTANSLVKVRHDLSLSVLRGLLCVGYFVICCARLTSAQSVSNVYVTDAFSNAITQYTLDPSTGTLTQQGVVATPEPIYMQATPSGKFLYAPNDTNPGSVSAFAINQTTGALTPVPGSPFATGSNPYAVTVSPSGRYLYVANSGSNTLSAFAIDANTGVLTTVAGSPFSVGQTPYEVGVSPSGNFIYVANSASDSISGFSVDQITGTLTPIPESPFQDPGVSRDATGGGASPQWVTVSPSGQFAYVANAHSWKIAVYKIDQISGALTAIAGSPFDSPASPSQVTFARSGQLAYITQNGTPFGRTDGAISVFTVNTTTGSMTPLAGSPFPSGDATTYFALDPSGAFGYSTNYYDATVTGFSVNPDTGALTKLSGSPFPTGANPRSVVIVGQSTTCPIGGIGPLALSSVYPAQGGNTGQVTVTVRGCDITNTSTLTLKGAFEPDIPSSSVTILQPGTLASATFDLTGQAPGARDVVVTNTTAGTAQLPGAFTIQGGGSPQISVDLIGFDKIRIGRAQPYFLSVLNTGSVDAPFVEADVPASMQSTGAQAQFIVPQVGVNVPQASGLLSQYLGPLAAGSTFSAPLILTGVSGPCKTEIGNVRTLNANSPCGRLEAGRASIEAYLATLYAGRIANLLLWMDSLLPTSYGGKGVCFDPANRFTKVACDVFEGIDDTDEALIKPAENANNYLCALAKNAGCPVDCLLPSEIDVLGNLAESMRAEVERLKDLFALATIPVSQVKTEDDKVAVFLTQALALPSALTFPSASSPLLDTKPPDDSSSLTICPVSSLDPNELDGTSGVGSQRWISGRNELNYAIYFANKDTATAPAQSVTIRDQFDINQFDLNTMKLQFVGFGATTVPVGATSGYLGLSKFSTNIDLRPTMPLVVQVTASLDMASGAFICNLTSLDPNTGRPPADPSIGVLPAGVGGSILLSVLPKLSLMTGTVISDSASIVFDTNSAINTQTWTNTVDSVPPTSNVLSLSPQQKLLSFPVQWSATDVGAGVQDFTVFVSDNGGSFTVWQQNVQPTSAIFTGQSDHTYSFYSIARDLVGNIEVSKSSAEATTKIETDITPPIVTPQISGTLGTNGWYRSVVSVSWNVSDPESGIATSSGCGPVNLTNDTTGIILTCSATNGAGLSTSVPITIRIDKTPPTLLSPGPITAYAHRVRGTIVTYSATASDAIDPHPTVICTPASGSTFAVGTTSVSCTATDAAGNFASTSFNIDIVGPDDLALAMVAPLRVEAGENMTYLIGVADLGPATGYQVIVKDILPPGTAFVSASWHRGDCTLGARELIASPLAKGMPCAYASETVTCSIGTLPRLSFKNPEGAVVLITVRDTAGPGSTIKNTATVTSADFDRNRANNSSTAVTRVRR